MKKPDCTGCTLAREQMACLQPGGKGGPGCVTVGREDLVEKARAAYGDGETLRLAREASIQEGEGYANRHERPYVPQPVKPRIVETCEFARRMGYERIGLVFCIGLMEESRMVGEILEAHGFEVVSVVCKAGAVPKEEIGVADEQKILIGTFEAMCNPVLQAEVVNDASTDLNVVMGLCVGHDALFLKHAEAPCTVLVAKDRVTGHNPLAAITTSYGYHSRVKKRGTDG